MVNGNFARSDKSVTSSGCTPAGVHPDDVTDLSDLAKFPFTTKSDLRDHYPFGMFAVPDKEIIRVHASSGTTGKSTVVGYTKHDIDIWAQISISCLV